MKSEIPVMSLQRLPIYLNYLKSLSKDENFYISSGAIARALNMGEVLVRKDLAYTSALGRTRVGYVMTELIDALEDFLGCNDRKNAVIIGAGELGKALLAYGGFENYGIELLAAFDNDPQKIGTLVANKPVYSVDELYSGVEKLGVRLAVICVPASHAQEAADMLVKCGVKGILNFAPLLLQVPEGFTVRNIDVAANLAILSSGI